MSCTCGHRETEARPWTLPCMLIPCEWEEEAKPPCPNAGKETLKKLLARMPVFQEDVEVEHWEPIRKHGLMGLPAGRNAFVGRKKGANAFPGPSQNRERQPYVLAVPF